MDDMDKKDDTLYPHKPILCAKWSLLNFSVPSALSACKTKKEEDTIPEET